MRAMSHLWPSNWCHSIPELVCVCLLCTYTSCIWSCTCSAPRRPTSTAFDLVFLYFHLGILYPNPTWASLSRSTCCSCINCEPINEPLDMIHSLASEFSRNLQIRSAALCLPLYRSRRSQGATKAPQSRPALPVTALCAPEVCRMDQT